MSYEIEILLNVLEFNSLLFIRLLHLQYLLNFSLWLQFILTQTCFLCYINLIIIKES